MRKRFERRDVLKYGVGAAGLGIAGPAFAQSNTALEMLGDVLGVPIPKILAEKVKLPGKPLNRVRVISAILELEKQANVRGLALSPLDAIEKPPLVPVDDGFYRSTVPRLVTLIDRSEGKDAETAEQAGELLAEVHATEHVVPDALKPAPAVPVPLSTARNFPALKDEYARLFNTAEIRPEHKEALAWQAKLIAQAKLRYESVGKDVQVPWFFIGAIHGLEASFNFRAHLHNGDFPLAQRTRQVPAGRPSVWLPPSDWESSAKDAIKLLGFANQTDWSLERTLYRLEAYNGFGYRKQRVASPYLWCFSNHYEKGKFTSDGKWSPTAKSRQCGAATLIKALVDAGDVKFG